MPDSAEQRLAPLHVFRFHVSFKRDALRSEGTNGPVSICSGAFSECTGLEATMEPKVIKAGGANYGDAQRAGPVTFATVPWNQFSFHFFCYSRPKELNQERLKRNGAS
jgi:hypothetical protein